MPKPPKTTAEITLDNVEDALISLYLRHKRHQRLMDDHRERRATARERHHRGWHRRKLAPIHLAY